MARITHDPQEAIAALRAGRLVALPTETVYGLAGDARRADAVRSIFAAKGRPADHPLIVHVADAGAAEALAARWPSTARRLAQAFWPGPLTMIVPKAAAVDPLVTGGQDSVGLRVPAHPLALAVLAGFAGPIAAPSANRFGRVSPTAAEHVLEEFPEHDLLVLDGGACPVGVESTIVDLTGETLRVLRPGRIRAQAIEQALALPLAESLAGAPRASGMLASHYAPSRPAWRCDPATLMAALAVLAARGWKMALIHHSQPLVLPPEVAANVVAQTLLAADEAETWERSLYAALRAADRPGVDAIVVETPPSGAAWEAVHDRLRRATAATDILTGE